MSPGSTFERVYNELRRMLAEGALPPGVPIEPGKVGKEIASSITPVRDALHRLTGERLVEAPNHNGFRATLPTESGLRDLYGWNLELLLLAMRRGRHGEATVSARLAKSSDTAARTATLFAEIAQATGSPEHLRAIHNLNDRLAPYRRSEAGLFDDADAEVDQLIITASDGKRADLSNLLRRYHRRRAAAAPRLLFEASAKL
jgi:DNA-binding GntR family transcriptional regulator